MLCIYVAGQHIFRVSNATLLNFHLNSILHKAHQESTWSTFWQFCSRLLEDRRIIRSLNLETLTQNQWRQEAVTLRASEGSGWTLVCFRLSWLRSGSVCRAVLAAEGGGGASAGPRGKGRPAAQHRSWWSGGRHSLQDGLPSRNKVCLKLKYVAACLNEHWDDWPNYIQLLLLLLFFKYDLYIQISVISFPKSQPSVQKFGLGKTFSCFLFSPKLHWF